MTTAQCNRRRRWSSLQCVRDGQRTKDHENNARHATNKQNQQQYCMRHMPAAMVHGGGGVLLMMTTKFASQEKINKHKIVASARVPTSRTASSTLGVSSAVSLRLLEAGRYIQTTEALGAEDP